MDAAFSLTRGAKAARDITTPTDCELDDAVADLIDALGRARWCERAPNRDPSDLDHMSSINPADFASEWPWIKDRFHYFAESSIPAVETAADDVEAALNELRASNMGALLDAKDSTAGWAGDAKDAFTNGFLNRLILPGIAEQQRLLGELQAALWAYDIVLRQARLNARNLAVESAKVLDSLSETSPSDAKVALGIVAVVVGTMTSFGAAAGGEIALGLLNTGLAGASTAIDAGTSVTGDTTDEVMATVLAALDALTEEMNAAEQFIADAVSGTQEAVEVDLRRPTPILMPGEPKDTVPALTSGEIPCKAQFRPFT